MNEKQLQQMTSKKGFIAALDQSGGSTPKALRLYGIPEDKYNRINIIFKILDLSLCFFNSSTLFSIAFSPFNILIKICF